MPPNHTKELGSLSLALSSICLLSLKHPSTVRIKPLNAVTPFVFKLSITCKLRRHRNAISIIIIHFLRPLFVYLILKIYLIFSFKNQVLEHCFCSSFHQKFFLLQVSYFFNTSAISLVCKTVTCTCTHIHMYYYYNLIMYPKILAR